VIPDPGPGRSDANLLGASRPGSPDDRRIKMIFAAERSESGGSLECESLQLWAHLVDLMEVGAGRKVGIDCDAVAVGVIVCLWPAEDLKLGAGG